MASYPLQIVTPNGKALEEEVDSLVAPGVEGFFGILANHAPFISTLKKGLIKIIKNKEDSFFVLNEGILEVKESGDVLILSSECIPIDSPEESDKIISQFSEE